VDSAIGRASFVSLQLDSWIVPVVDDFPSSGDSAMVCSELSSQPNVPPVSVHIRLAPDDTEFRAGEQSAW